MISCIHSGNSLHIVWHLGLTTFRPIIWSSDLLGMNYLARPFTSHTVLFIFLCVYRFLCNQNQFTYRRQLSFSSLKNQIFFLFNVFCFSLIVLLIDSLTVSYIYVFLPPLLRHILPYTKSPSTFISVLFYFCFVTHCI